MIAVQKHCVNPLRGGAGGRGGEGCNEMVSMILNTTILSVVQKEVKQFPHWVVSCIVNE